MSTVKMYPKEQHGSKLWLKLNKICEFFWSFLLMSTIHGLNHIAAPKRHPLEVLIWASLVAVGLYFASILSSLTLNRYFENPTVISMERDRFSWNTSFPSATICPSTKLDEEKLQDYLDKSSETNKTLLRNFIISLANAGYENFDSVIDYPQIPPEEYMDLMINLRFDFKPTLSNSGVTGRQYKLDLVFNEFGVCYCFNSQLAVYNSPRYWKDNRWDVQQENETFYVNPLDGEVFANVVNLSTGYKLIIHGPFEVADVSSKIMDSPNGYFLQVYLMALSIYSSDRARSLQINQRKCRFYDESNLKHSPVYSYVLCRMECRLQLARKLCGCLPHFYRKLDTDRLCDVKGLHCLAQHKERLIAVKGECDCHNNCDEVNYIVQHFDSREWFLGSNLQWGLKEYPRMRLKRDVIFGFADVLVYVGGMAGLFFGASVLSFAEIFYFFSLRLFWFIVRSQKDEEKNKVTSLPSTADTTNNKDESEESRPPSINRKLIAIANKSNRMKSIARRHRVLFDSERF